jgi:hypothetical protein
VRSDKPESGARPQSAAANAEKEDSNSELEIPNCPRRASSKAENC